VRVKVGQIISLSAFFALIGNTITAIVGSFDLLTIAAHVVPPFAVVVFGLSMRHPKKSTVANAFMVISWVWAALGGVGNLGPAVAIIFALYIHISDKRMIATLSGVLIVTVAKFALHGYTVAQFFTYNSGYMFAIGFYWYYIHPRGSGLFTPHEGHPIDELTLTILHLMAEGYQTKEVADRVFLSREAVSKRLSRVRKELGARNNEQLFAYLTLKGIIRPTEPGEASHMGNHSPNGDNPFQA
jgi:DNA-binding CsgD family transcriptional regulator